MSDHPDLIAYRLIHQGMRADTARMVSAVSRMDEADRAARAPALTRWYAGFLGEFHAHHTVEDDILFPALADKVTVFAGQLERLHDDHRRLESALTAVDEAVRQLADRGVSWSSVHGDAVDAITGAHHELTRHLDYEDADVLPLFVEHMSVVEYEEVEERARKTASPSQLAFTIPWVVTQTTDEQRRRLLEGAPLSLRLLWYATRRRYGRLAARAFVDAAAAEPVLAPPV